MSKSESTETWHLYWPLDKTPESSSYDWDMETKQLYLRSPAGRSDCLIWR